MKGKAAKKRNVIDGREVRIAPLNLALESRADQELPHITGYAAVFNKPSVDMGFVERIAPGAFAKALTRSAPVALVNHQVSEIIGRAGVNLDLAEDKKGLWIDISPIETPRFEQVVAEIRAGLFVGQSFGFTVKADEWQDLDTDKPKRLITEVNHLYDVGPVVFPAYTATDIGVRSVDQAQKTLEAALEAFRIQTSGITGNPGSDDQKIKDSYARNFVRVKTLAAQLLFKGGL